MALNGDPTDAYGYPIYSPAPSSFTDRDTDATEVSYATDENDNAFIHLIVHAVEICLGWQSLKDEEEKASAELLKIQGAVDNFQDESFRYSDRAEPLLRALEAKCDENVELLEARLAERKAQFGPQQERVKEALWLRGKVLKDLYAKAGDFMHRSITGKVKGCTMSFLGPFNEGLASLVYAAQSLTDDIARFK